MKSYYEYDDDINETRYDVHDCPFCGSKETDLYQTQVRCNRCNAHGPEVGDEIWPMAITLWNELPRKQGDELKKLRSYWSNLLRKIRRAEKKAALVKARKEKDRSKVWSEQRQAWVSPLTLEREYSQWARKRAAWLHGPVDKDTTK